MTELEQARAHLRRCQAWLEVARQSRCESPILDRDNITHATGDVLAALSWVWDAQERERAGRPSLGIGATVFYDGRPHQIVAVATPEACSIAPMKVEPSAFTALRRELLDRQAAQ